MLSNFFIVSFLMFFTLALKANLDYADGQNLQQRYSYLRFVSNSKRVDIPIDHNHPHLGHFSLYSHFLRPYDAKRPTLIYMGSTFGQSIHTFGSSLIQYLQSLEYNVLLVEPRGVGFSKPNSERTQNSPLFFSLEAMAHDLEYVRKDLKLSSITLMSSGFSSSIALIYAHYYPQSVKNIVMENPVVLIKSSLQINPKLTDAAHQYLQTLKPEILEKAKSLNLLDPAGQDHWLLAIVKSVLTSYHPEKLSILTRLLENYAGLDGSFYVFRIQINLARELATESISNADHLEALFDYQIHSYLTYQYFNAYAPQSKLRWHFSPKGNLQQSSLRQSDLTGPLFKNKSEITKPFSPENYPIKSSVNIIYGGMDIYSSPQQLQAINFGNKGYVIESPLFGRNPLLQLNHNEGIPYTFTFENKPVLKIQKWLVAPLLRAKPFKASDHKAWQEKFTSMPISILKHYQDPILNLDCNTLLKGE